MRLNRQNFAPDMLRSSKLGRNRQLAAILAFGFDVDHERAASALGWAEECRADWLAAHGNQDLPNDDLGALLREVVSDAVAGAGLGRPLTLGLSGGYDSRPILQACWELGLAPHTYTFGQPGNLDFDVASLVAPRLGLDTTMIDTNRLRWTLNHFDEAARKVRDLPLSPRVPTAVCIDTAVPNRTDLHGYLNGWLTGAMRTSGVNSPWSEAVREFATRNDPFGLQRHMAPKLVDALLPRRPIRGAGSIPVYQQLVFGFRLTQRIRPVSSGSHLLATPYEDPRWVGFWMSRPAETSLDQRRWLSYVHHLNRDLFFDVHAVAHSTSRRELRRLRIDLFYGSEGTPGIAPVTGLAVPPNPTEHFSVLACARNNESFRAMLHDSLRRLRKRRVVYETFVDDAWQRLLAGDPEAGLVINGLVTLDTVLEAGRLP